MTGNAPHSVLLIGGPDAGKSNFLFRLWIAIDGGNGALVKDVLPPNVEYLREGAERLLEGQFAGHTSKEVYEQVIIPVKSAEGEISGTLLVPDVSGEQVLTICTNRRWPPVWEALISQQCAALLFVRAGSDEVVSPLDWSTCFEKYGAVITTTTPKGQPEQILDDEAEAQEEATALPTQVVLTEWLQFLRWAFTQNLGGAFRPRIGIVVSAWDAVPVDQQDDSPLQYLQDNFPMFYQFIETNSASFDFQIFGVSIVNGDLKNDEEFKEVYLEGTPQDFGLVVHSLSGQQQRSSDITLPVAWAAGLPLIASRKE